MKRREFIRTTALVLACTAIVPLAAQHPPKTIYLKDGDSLEKALLWAHRYKGEVTIHLTGSGCYQANDEIKENVSIMMHGGYLKLGNNTRLAGSITGETRSYTTFTYTL